MVDPKLIARLEAVMARAIEVQNRLRAAGIHALGSINRVAYANIRVAGFLSVDEFRAAFAHNARLIPVSNADLSVSNWLLAGPEDIDAIVARHREIMDKGNYGKPLKANGGPSRKRLIATEVIVPLPYREWAEAQGEDGVRKFVQDAMTFIEARFVNHGLIHAVLHLDEETPHIQALGVCMTDKPDGRVVRHGYDPTLMSREWRLSQDHVFGRGKAGASVLQTEFHAHMKKAGWSLKRGEPALLTNAKNQIARDLREIRREIDDIVEMIPEAVSLVQSVTSGTSASLDAWRQAEEALATAQRMTDAIHAAAHAEAARIKAEAAEEAAKVKADAERQKADADRRIAEADADVTLAAGLRADADEDRRRARDLLDFAEAEMAKADAMWNVVVAVRSEADRQIAAVDATLTDLAERGLLDDLEARRVRRELAERPIEVQTIDMGQEEMRPTGTDGVAVPLPRAAPPFPTVVSIDEMLRRRQAMGR